MAGVRVRVVACWLQKLQRPLAVQPAVRLTVRLGGSSRNGGCAAGSQQSCCSCGWPGSERDGKERHIVQS